MKYKKDARSKMNKSLTLLAIEGLALYYIEIAKKVFNDCPELLDIKTSTIKEFMELVKDATDEEQ